MSNRIKELAKAVRENPADSFYKFTLALEMIKVDKLNQARVLFESIKDNDPGYIGVYYHLAKLYEGLNMNKEALNTYKQGIEVANKQNDLHTMSELSAALLNLELEMKED